MNIRVLLLVVLAAYIPFQLHLPTSLFGLKGINVFNMILLLALAAMVLRPRTLEPPIVPLRTSMFLYYITATLGLVIAVAAGTGHLIDDITRLKTILTYGFLYFVAFHTTDNKRVIIGLVICIMIVVFAAAVQTAGEGWSAGFDRFANWKRSSGPFGLDHANANYAGAFFCFFLPLAMACALFLKKNLVLRSASIALLAIGGVAVFATYSRQAFLIIGITALIIAAWRNLMYGLLVVFVLANIALWAPTSVMQRIEMTTQTNEFGEEQLEDSARSRPILWGIAWELVKKEPYGVGLNQFRDRVDPYVPSWIIARDAHSQFVLAATELGIQGFLVFVLLLFGLLRLGIKLARRTEDSAGRILGIGFTGGVIALALANTNNSLFSAGEIMGNFWILSGLVAKYVWLGQESHSEVTEPEASPLGTRFWTANQTQAVLKD